MAGAAATATGVGSALSGWPHADAIISAADGNSVLYFIIGSTLRVRPMVPASRSERLPDAERHVGASGRSVEMVTERVSDHIGDGDTIGLGAAR